MRFKSCHLLAAASAALLAAMPAAAQEDDNRSTFSIGVTAGTLGVGPVVGARLSPTFGVRASATFIDASHDVDVDDINYHGKLKLESYGANLDVYPFGGGFRLSPGFRIDKNRIGLDATPTAAVEVGDTVYTPAQIGTLSGSVKAKDFAPTLTIGYAGGLTKGIKFGFDAGAMFQGSPRITDLKATGSLASDPAFVAELAKEQREIDDEVHKYNVYPILQFSLFYAF